MGGRGALGGLAGRLLRYSLALCVAGVMLAAQAEPLRVLAWPGYADPDVVRAFETRFGAVVEVTEIGSDDALWNLVNGPDGARYDLIAANTAELQRYLDRQLLLPLRLENIPNTRGQAARFRKLSAIPGVMRGDKTYAVPYTYSGMGLIYNRKRVPEPPTSMQAMWDPRYRGKVLAYDGSSHNFSLTALTLGFRDPFRLDANQFATVVNRLRALRPQIAAFYSTPEEAADLFKRHDIALVFANYGDQQVAQLRKAGADIGYVIPREGALAWLDCWAVLASTRNRDLAEAWINHTLTAEVSSKLTQRHGLANTRAESTPESLRDTDRLVWLRPVEDYPKRTLYWERILSGYNKAR